MSRTNPVSRSFKTGSIFRSNGNSRKAAVNCFYAALMKKIHKRFVSKAHSLGLLNPEVNELSNNRKKVIILVADSTFLICRTPQLDL